MPQMASIFRVFRQHRAHFMAVSPCTSEETADRFQLVNARMLFQQLLIGGGGVPSAGSRLPG